MSPDAPPAPEATEHGWSPPAAILERLRRADEDDWHEERRNSERCYLGTLLCWSPSDFRATVRIAPADMHFDLHRILLAEIRDAFPWTDASLLIVALAGGAASKRWNPQLVRDELAACYELALPFVEVDEAARAVMYHNARAARAKLIETMRGHAHDPAHLRTLCATLLST